MDKIIFIYNANSGRLNGYLDALHKVISPQTYKCKLCDLTYGVLTENKVWKKFRTSTPVPMEFLHLDEFKKGYASKFASKYTFPLILVVNKGELEILISTEEINQLQDVEQLIRLISERHTTISNP